MSVRAVVSKSFRGPSPGTWAPVKRYHVAEEASDADAIAHALAEAIMWLDVLAEQRPELRGDAVVPAMQFARGRSHHHLASVIERPDPNEPWRWRRSSLFPGDPDHDDSKLERCYPAVAGKPVRETLAVAGEPSIGSWRRASRSRPRRRRRRTPPAADRPSGAASGSTCPPARGSTCQHDREVGTRVHGRAASHSAHAPDSPAAP